MATCPCKGELLYYKCMTPSFLKTKVIEKGLTTGSDDTELKIGTDAAPFEVILDEPLLGEKLAGEADRKDLTVVINIAAEGPKPSFYDPLSVCITDRKNVMGVQLRDPSEYSKADLGPYMGIYGTFGRILTDTKILQSSEKEQNFRPETWMRWPQMFNIRLKPDPTGGVFGFPAWGLCSSALAGGTSLSYIYPKKLEVDNGLDLILYRYHASEQYTINMIEVTVYRDSTS